MSVWYEHRSTCFVIHVDERDLTEAVVDPVRQIITIAFLHGQYNLLFDLSSCGMIDSYFVGLMISTYREVDKLGGTMICGGVRGQVDQAFRVIRLDQLVDIYPTLDEAIQKMKEVTAGSLEENHEPYI
ncbi:MAG: STAS domain-containing protein [bacterium]|jgi:anti-anti-sigma factor|nr:STAS domain-containing protein [bacterium]